MNDLEKLVISNKPVICEKCKGKMDYVGSGKYKCQDCGVEVLDDFGKVKDFLDKHGPSPAIVIEQGTGVSSTLIEKFLKKGRVEIPEGSTYYLKCEKCGCSIRYGRYCPECVTKLTSGIKAAFNEDMGERPKRGLEKEKELQGKMHYIKGKK